jgi:dTDP-4-dehydrorhamnose reductase
MRIAVTGAYGQLGGELARQLGTDAIPLDIDTLDLTNARAVDARLTDLAPDAVINCAAYTQVDRAETDAARCRAVNAGAVEHLVRVCRTLDCPLVQISTDYVFCAEDGRPLPYNEADPPSPRGVYARTKYEGELAAARHPRHLIVRTCGLYARPGDDGARNFVKTMLRLGQTHDELRVVADQHCTPSYVPHVAQAILFLLGVETAAPAPWGIYHVTNRGATTWYEFAAEIFRLAEMDVALKRITTSQYAAPAPRPEYSILDTTKYHRLGGPPMPTWREALEEYFAEFACRVG